MLSNDWEFQGMREATFLLRSNSHVKHYHDAHHSSAFQPPFDLCGALNKLWEDVYKAIEGAKYLVYIAGWSFNPMMVLPRKVGPVDNNNTHTIMNSNSTADIRTSWVIDPHTEIPHATGIKLGELFKKKTEEGVELES
ncbi:hypothetical protein JHK87_006317 [Glycine soja]|nr:hypothetical protein JHK87_006317 [Glycine soja]